MAAAVDTQYASGTQCIDYIDSCPIGQELSEALNDAQRVCQDCNAGHYKNIVGSSACLPHTTCLAGTEIQIGAPSNEVDRVCGCAEDYHYSGTECQACASGTRLAGDPKTTATQCCVGGYQSAIGGECIAFSEDAQTCNALRRPLITGDENTDAQCGALCDASTEFAQGTQCVLLKTACPAGQDLQGASNDTDYSCTPCGAGLFKKEADGSQCIACQDGYEVIPLDSSSGATDCIICDRATEYDHDGLAHSGCIATHDKCHKSFQLIITNETRPNICEECSPEHYQDLDNTTEQCKPWTVCEIGSTEVELLAPSLAVNRVCGCAEDHYFDGSDCQACAQGTRLAGDPKTEASQCCVDAYQSAVGATSTAYSEDATSCNALRRPLIEGTSSQDAACAQACDQATEFAQGTGCVAFITTCGPGLFLTGGSNDTQKTCDACPAATFKATNGPEACSACAAGSEVSEDKTACMHTLHYRNTL